MGCEFRKTCDLGACPALKRTCARYAQYFIKLLYELLPSPHPDPVQIRDAEVCTVGCWYSQSQQKVQARLIKTVYSHLEKVKILGYNTAIQAALEGAYPDERIVYIDATSRYPENAKAMQAIEGLIDGCVIAKKIVFMVVRADYINTHYSRC